MARPALRSFAAAALAFTAGVAAAGQGDPTPRKDIEPWDKAKVISIEAQQWRRFGLNDAQRIDTRSGNIPGKQSCTTTIGAPPPADQRMRFGPQPQSQTVVVTGSVINVCK